MISSTIGSRLSRRDVELAGERRLGLRRSNGGASPTPSEAEDGEASAAMITIAGPDVQIIAPMCCLAVTPPTIDGTSTVVSESGVILSPK